MRNITDTLPQRWRPFAKAIVSGVSVLVVTVVGALLLVIDPGETLADVTFREWLIVAMTIVGGSGAAAGGAYGARYEEREHRTEPIDPADYPGYDPNVRGIDDVGSGFATDSPESGEPPPQV